MVSPRKRCRSSKRSHKKVPGGKTALHFKKGKVARTRCTICKRPLSGIPRKRPSETRKLSKSERTPNRAYGDRLCPSCARAVIKEEVRGGAL